MTTNRQVGDADIPQGLIDAVAHLVSTGPVPLGGYTLAEIDAVGGVVHFLEEEPSDEVIAEAVRSLAARNLITTAPGSPEIEVRGDLGIALAFQQRARVVVDSRVTGSQPERPWRFVLMPQPEGVTLEILIDALGIHFFALRTTAEAFERLWRRLPAGERGHANADAEAVLAASPATALVSVTRWDDAGDRHTHDLVLAQDAARCHVFLRDEIQPSRLVAHPLTTDEWHALVVGLAAASADDRPRPPP
jgi:hypothetical protein